MDAGDILSSGRVRQSIVRAEPESYVLNVTRDSVIIEAGDSAGLFYASHTLS